MPYPPVRSEQAPVAFTEPSYYGNVFTAPAAPASGGVKYGYGNGAFWKDPSGAVATMLSPSEFSASPSGCLGETVPRYAVSSAAVAIGGNTGIVMFNAAWFPAGTTVTNINWVTGGTAATSPSHWWLGLLDSAGTQRGHTADQTTGAIAANTLITKPLAAPYQATYTGLYYFTVSVTATANPTSSGIAVSPAAGVAGLAPLLAVLSAGAFTTPGTDGTTTYTIPSAGAVGVAYMFAT